MPISAPSTSPRSRASIPAGRVYPGAACEDLSVRLTVLSVAYPFAPVGPEAVGGAEQVLGLVDEALVAAGHVSLVIACEGSRVHGTLLSTPLPREPVDEPGRVATYAGVRARLRQALSEYPVDLVHLHGIDCHRYLPEVDIPILV